jgi:hypothetical protein
MEQSFACPWCGRETTYRPEECESLIRSESEGRERKEVRYCLIRCAGCGDDLAAPEALR